VLRRYAATLRFAPPLHGPPGAQGLGAGLPRAVGEPDAARALALRFAGTRPRVAGPWPMGALAAAIPAHEHRAKVELAQRYIAAGETYQVNLSQRFTAPWSAGPCDGAAALARRALDLHMRVRERADAPMGALLHVHDDAWFVSNSPETLLHLRHDLERGTTRVTSWPIKGTRPRGHDATSDAAALAALQRSEKDLAEHVMIVDLVRNDLGRIAVPGSVRAPARPSVMSLPTVHHLVSEVSCVLLPGTSLRRVFEALFPGGSITGAPKRRTVELIAELEAEAREVYCGAILCADAHGVRVSIPIRTAILRPSGVELRSGGGIVADSDPEAERLETEVKTRAFLRVSVAADAPSGVECGVASGVEPGVA
jgi:anthranilate/para-aminobenzoate synthase component I